MIKKQFPLYCKANDGTKVISTGNLYRIIAEGKQTQNRFSIMEVILQPNQGAPLHIHTREDEAFFILEGKVTFYSNDSEIVAKKEDFISFAPQEIRGFKNNINSKARMLIFYSSAGIEEMTLRNGEIQSNEFKYSEEKQYTAQCPLLAEEYGIKEL